jgi:hypothetical protein
VVRLQARGAVLGVYAAPPQDCVVLVVLPLAEPVAPDSPLDEVVSAGRMRDVVGDVSSPGRRTRVTVAVPDGVGPAAPLAVLPPRTGWLSGERGIAGDVSPLVASAVADYRALVESDPGAAGALLADQIWSRPGWGGIPLQALHVARQLGMLAHDGLRLETGTAPGWKRLVTPTGQVFVRTTDAPTRLGLTVVT